MKPRRTVSSLASSFFTNRTHEMYCTDDSALPDEPVAVEADYQPEEHDTNTAEGVEITAVWHEDNGDKIDLLAESELEEMAEELLARFRSYCEAYYEGDG